jgi:hypothetical protein
MIETLKFGSDWGITHGRLDPDCIVVSKFNPETGEIEIKLRGFEN